VQRIVATRALIRRARIARATRFSLAPSPCLRNSAKEKPLQDGEGAGRSFDPDLALHQQLVGLDMMFEVLLRRGQRKTQALK